MASFTYMESNSAKPATKADVAKVSDDVDKLAIATKNTFDRIEAKMATKDDLKAFATKDDLKAFATKESQERILSIVESIDQHFKEHRDIPRRVEQLEVDVFKLQTRPR